MDQFVSGFTTVGAVAMASQDGFVVSVPGGEFEGREFFVVCDRPQQPRRMEMVEITIDDQGEVTHWTRWGR